MAFVGVVLFDSSVKAPLLHSKLLCFLAIHRCIVTIFQSFNQVYELLQICSGYHAVEDCLKQLTNIARWLISHATNIALNFGKCIFHFFAFEWFLMALLPDYIRRLPVPPFSFR